MGIFNMFGEQEHRVFNYKPIHYDPQKEELKRRFGKVDGTMDKEMASEDYVPGSYIKGSMRDAHYKNTRSTSNRVQNTIGLIGLLLIAVILIYILKFYSLL